MVKLKTVRVVNPNESGPLIINETDFKPGVHKLYNESPDELEGLDNRQIMALAKKEGFILEGVSWNSNPEKVKRAYTLAKEEALDDLEDEDEDGLDDEDDESDEDDDDE